MFKLVDSAYALLFPGQGAQFAGMIHKLRKSPAAQDLLQTGEKILGTPILSLMNTGHADILGHTLNAQPAVFLASMGHLTALRAHIQTLDQPSNPVAYCGHSLGQITAFVAAGALSFEAGLKLIQVRAQVMDEASQTRPGLMAAVLGLELDQVTEIHRRASAAGVLSIANFNGPAQYVFSGETAAVQLARQYAEEAKAKKTVVLRVTTASHSPLMQAAQERFSHYLDSVEILDPQIPVLLNTTAKLTSSAAEIRQELQTHLCLPVQWENSVWNLKAAGVSLFLDVGPGAVLEKLVLHQLPDAKVASVGFLQSVDRILN